MICEKCKQEGKTSKIYIGNSYSTLMASPPSYYDERGNLVIPKNPNVTTTEYTCSEGHTWRESS